LAEEEGAEDKLIRSLAGEAVKSVFGRYADAEGTTHHRAVQRQPDVPAGDDLSADEFVANMKA
jgi:hypothetical protein